MKNTDYRKSVFDSWCCALEEYFDDLRMMINIDDGSDLKFCKVVAYFDQKNIFQYLQVGVAYTRASVQLCQVRG